MTATLKFEGTEKFVKQLGKLTGNIDKAAAKLLNNEGQKLRTAVRREAPKGKTGNLRKGIKVTKRAKPGSLSAFVRNTSRHGHFVELGTDAKRDKGNPNRGQMPSNPFFDRAHKKFAPGFETRARVLIKKVIDAI